MQPANESDRFNNPYATPLASSATSTKDTGKFRPFITIWTHPRDTVRRIVAQDPALHVVLLACLAGIGESLDRASTRNAGEQIPTAVIIGLVCIFGPLGGLLSLWLFSHLIRLSGTWIGGVAVREHIKTAIAWASVPVVVALPLWIPQLALLGSDMFTEEMPRLDAQPTLLIPFLAIGLAEIVLSLWSLVLLCNTIAEVQGFRSAWRGLGNIILAGAVIMVPLFVIAFGLVFLLWH